MLWKHTGQMQPLLNTCLLLVASSSTPLPRGGASTSFMILPHPPVQRPHLHSSSSTTVVCHGRGAGLRAPPDRSPHPHLPPLHGHPAGAGQRLDGVQETGMQTQEEGWTGLVIQLHQVILTHGSFPTDHKHGTKRPRKRLSQAWQNFQESLSRQDVNI